MLHIGYILFYSIYIIAHLTFQYKYTPLNFAVTLQLDIHVIKRLITTDSINIASEVCIASIVICVNCCTQNGYTPLHFAVTNKDVEVVELLLSNNAEVNTESLDYVCCYTIILL